MHLEKSKQLITWDGESTCSWQYPKTRRWKLPCSYMTHSLMENSNSFRIKKYPTDDRHGADRCAPSPVQTISKLIPRYDFLAVATQSSQKNWTLCKDIGILLATETKEFSEAGILRLPPDLSPSFRVLHSLAQWTVSTGKAFKLRVKFSTSVDSVHYFLSGKRLIVTAKKDLVPESLFHDRCCKGSSILIMNLVDDMIWSCVQSSFPQPKYMSTSIYLVFPI